jgi:hypothetical protein
MAAPPTSACFDRLDAAFSVRYTAALVLVALTACGSPVTETPTPTSMIVPTIAPGDPLAVQLARFVPDEVGMGALLTGTLRGAGVCLVVDDELGNTWLTAWPATATWDPQTGRIRLGTAELGLGEVGLFGGGEVTLYSSTDPAVRWTRPPPSVCLPTKAWFVYTLEEAGGHRP